MNHKIVWLAFTTVAFAELGDKTQISTIILCADRGSPLVILLGAIAAFATVNAAGIIIGHKLSKIIPRRMVSIIAGAVFLTVGASFLIGI
jgi:putative Ca2+/H+ antiporter (TMEM165/GDT1 family)